jgi:hypothetical protein
MAFSEIYPELLIGVALQQLPDPITVVGRRHTQKEKRLQALPREEENQEIR